MLTLSDRLVESARRFPTSRAVVYRGRARTYEQLYRRASALAAFLHGMGLRPGERAAIYLPKTIEAIESIHAVLLAGACYVPIDPQTPLRRIEAIARDCRPKIILTRRKMLAAADTTSLPSGASCFFLDESASVRPRRKGDGLRGAKLDDPAYLLYTSGSTGTPKGIIMSHRNAAAFVDWAGRRFKCRPEDRIANLAPFQFDLSIFDIFGACSSGAALYLIPYPETLFPISISEFLAKNKITIFYTVPSVLSGIVDRAGARPGMFPSLRLLLFAGEVMPIKTLIAWKKLAPNAEFFNLYGPTETNVCLYYHARGKWEGRSALPIGRPLPKTQAIVIDSRRRPVPIGERGELCISGPTVMRGYVNQSALAQKPFIGLGPRPAKGKPVFYRTGDIVSREGDGNYYFWGRKDDQVKVRGYRVELREIEAVLMSHRNIREAAVLAVQQPDNTKKIVAYLSPSSGASTSKPEIKRYLSSRLPPYMIPEGIHFVREMPRLASGKIDHISLLGGA